MSRIIDIREAKTHLLRIVDEVAAGTEVVIAKSGQPVARLTPLTAVERAKNLGLLNGKFRVADVFNVPLPEDGIPSFEGP
jgi:prevent-host-death family protein